MAKQRQIRIEQRGAMAEMQQLENRSDEELEAEVKFKAAALAILGARAAERYDATKAREYFNRSIAAARPQERMQLRRMANASLALAERRAGDLKDAVTKLGQKPPSGKQLLVLRLMGMIVPPPGSSAFLRVRGVLALLAILIVLLAAGLGIVELIAIPFGGIGLGGGILLGLVLLVAVIAVLAVLGKRKQAKAQQNRRGG